MYGKDVVQGHATSEMNGETGSGMSGMHGMPGMPGMAGMSGMPRNVKFNFPGMMDPNELFKNMFAEDDISSRFSQTTRMCGNTTSFQFSMGNGGTRSNMSKTRPILEKDVILTLKELAIGTVKNMKLSATTVNGEPFTKIFTINVKPGWKDGTKITFSCSKYGGDIRFKVIEKPHSYLKRNGNNLYWNYKFPPEKINKGLRIELRTPFPDEVVKIETPKNQLYDGMKMVIDGKGMSIKGDVTNRGNLVIRFASATL
jgi:DnaJ-class molecular chaperone